jgi:hypothetical protein
MKKLIIVALMIISIISVNAQKTEKKSKKELRAEKAAKQKEEIKGIVESKTFVFDARNVNPMSGRSINLSTQYDVKITNDSIYSYLPYYGVAHNAVYGGTESPMIFSQPFETYTMEETKNGYHVKVVVKNGSDRLDFSFHISENGSTSLSVSSMNRQAISYYGDIVISREMNK